MLPEHDDDRQAALLRWANGDRMAAAFLLEIAEIARLADDIVDEDDNRQRNVGWLLHRTLTVLPQNPFFLANAARLAPLIAVVIVQWRQSDEWRGTRDALKRTFGFVYREAVGSIVTAVACLTGGPEHAKAAADDFFATCHSGSTETVAEWAMEK